MTGEQFSRLRSELEASFAGVRNAGRPLLLEGGLDWKSMSLSPRDMDFIEAKHAAARLLPRPHEFIVVSPRAP
jgi:phage portal protein BeeE